MPIHRIRPNYATNRTEKGDFSTRIARNLGITPEQRPWLFVVKKNKTVLTRLLGWIRNHVANAQRQGDGPAPRHPTCRFSSSMTRPTRQRGYEGDAA